MTPTSDRRPPSRRDARVRLRPRQAAVLVLLGLTAVFVGQNREPVNVELFTIDVLAPLWLVLALVGTVGLVAGLLLIRRH